MYGGCVLSDHGLLMGSIRVRRYIFSPSSSHLTIKENYSFSFYCLDIKRFAKWYLFSGLRYFVKKAKEVPLISVQFH